MSVVIRHMAVNKLLLMVLAIITGVILCISGTGSAASSGAVTWTRIPLPAEGEPGNWVLASGSDMHHLTMAADGTLYAYGEGLARTLYTSPDNGLGWTTAGNVQDVITDIAASPHDPATIYYATANTVYRSQDSGLTFGSLPFYPGNTGTGNRTIASLDVGWAEGHIIVVGTVDTDAGEYGGVYLLDEAAGTYQWEDTGIGNLDVYDVVFSPDYAADRQLVAAATDETDTYIVRKQGITAWNAVTGPATLNRDNAGIPVSVNATGAALAFPDNYSSNTASTRCILFAAVTTGTGSGDVYRIQGAAAPWVSTATDLNIGLVYGQNNVDTAGLAARGSYPAAMLVAGAAGGNSVYTSLNGGDTWLPSQKAPSGTAVTSVRLPPGETAPGIVYVTTSGTDSGFSISRDSGDTWNQTSFIDTTLTGIVDMAPSPGYEQDSTLFLLTSGSGHSLWRSLDIGTRWERLLSPGVTGVTALSFIGLPPGYGGDNPTLFCAGDSGGAPAIWESHDNGQAFNLRPTRDPVTGNPFAIDTWAVAGETTLFIGSFNGANGLVYRTDNGGYYFSEGVPAGSQLLSSLAISPAYGEDGTILTGTSDGRVYRSRDGGLSFWQLPVDTVSAPLSGSIAVAFDTGYCTNGVVYAAGDTANAGIHRFRTGTGIAWESIDATLPAGGIVNRLAIAGNGVLYAANSMIDGGMERCLSAVLQTGTAFDTVTRGLESGAVLNGIWPEGNHVWSTDTANNRLVRFDDTLTLPVIQTSPPDGNGIGSLSNHTVTRVELDWDPMEGATVYEWQCDDDAGFSAIASGMEGTATGSSVYLPALQPSMTYYWRVRAGSPVFSPWSTARTFTTPMDTEAVTLLPDSPVPGAADVPVQPVFHWTAVMGAEAYELLVAEDIDFSQLAIIRAGEYALPGNAWESDVRLEYGTTYYWKARAISGSTHSSWSASGIFTTAETPPQAPEAGEPETAAGSAVPGETIQAFSQADAPPVLFPPSPEEILPAPESLPVLIEQQPIPNWVLYFIGGLLAVILLTLVVLLAVVMKLRPR